MIAGIQDYGLFFRFLEAYSQKGFKGIGSDDKLMLELEQMMAKNNQFIYIADTIQLKILFTSKRSNELMGIDPADLNLSHFMEATHPNDIQRLSLGRTKLIKMAQDLFIAGKGSALISSNFKIKTPGGSYSEFLIQGYLFFSTIPYKTVYFLKIHTNIDWFKKLKHGYHYYVGSNMSYFRFPDEEILRMGNVFTKREFEIIKMIASGMNTEQIADELYLSIYTVNTHRGNILKKTEKAHISELIYDLKERGVL